MGHDLDQVMHHVPGALSTLRYQRSLLDQQIAALEKMVEAHNATILQYKVNENGNVEDVSPLLIPTPIEEKRTLKERVMEVFETMHDQALKAEDVTEFVEMDVKSLRATLATLRKQGRIDRVERGRYQYVKKEAQTA